MANLDPARWPGGPLICPVANLPAFPDLGAMKRFQASLCGDAVASWQCFECGHWHYWAKPFAPAGGSSGSTRGYKIPARMRTLILKTRVLPIKASL